MYAGYLRAIVCVLVVVLVKLLNPGTACAQAQQPPTGMPLPDAPQLTAGQESVFMNDCLCGDDGHRLAVRFIPYAWAMGMHGDVTVRGKTAPVDVSISKTLDIMFNELNVAAIGQVEVSNGTFGFLVNSVYADVSPGNQVGNIDFGSRFRAGFFDFAVTYNLHGLPEYCCLPCGSRIELLAGVRYNTLSANLTVTGPNGSATAGGTEDWLDPFVGARVRVPLNERLTAQLRGDIGGFEIGEASQFTWNIEATLEYRLSQHCSLLAGYRVLDINYSAREGNQSFGFDMTLHGPMLGLTIDF